MANNSLTRKTTPKEKYRMRRQEGLRGQGDPLKPKFYPKGEEIEPVERDGKKHFTPNAEGSHYIAVGNRLVKANRRKAREKIGREKDYAYSEGGRPFTMKGVKHKVNKHKYELPYAPSLTNHQRMQLREEERDEKRREASASASSPSGS